MATKQIANPVMTIHEAARYLNVTIGHVYILVWRGSILGEKIGRKWQIDPASVQNYADRRAVSEVEIVP